MLVVRDIVEVHEPAKVGDVPAFLEHVDVDDDLRGLGGALDPEESLDGLVALLAALVRVDGDDLVPAAALEEIVPLHVALDTDPDRSGVAVKSTLGWPARASLRERAILLPLL